MGSGDLGGRLKDADQARKAAAADGRADFIGFSNFLASPSSCRRLCVQLALSVLDGRPI